MFGKVRRPIQIALFTVLLVFSTMLVVTSFETPVWSHTGWSWHYERTEYESKWLFWHKTKEVYVGGSFHSAH